MRRFLVVLAGAVALPVLLSGNVRSAPPENADPALVPWFNSLRQPGTGALCCSIADCRPVDTQLGPNGYEVWIGGRWHSVPPERVIHGKDNPLGRGVVCYTPPLGVLCFIPGTEA